MGQYKEQIPPPNAKVKISNESHNAIQAIKDKEPVKSTFEEVCLDSHNGFRAMHGSPPLTLNKNLNFLANEWAQVRTTTTTTHVTYNGEQHTKITTTTSNSRTLD